MAMASVILCMAAGIALGFALRRHRLGWTSGVTTALVWLLLFLLGAGIGSEERVFRALGAIGLQATVVGTAATLGSAVAAWALWRTISNKRQR